MRPKLSPVLTDTVGIGLKLAVTLAVELYPVVTVVSMRDGLVTLDVLLLRFGVSGLLFVPYLKWCREVITRKQWIIGFGLAMLHGVGMAAVAVTGLTLAPASHQSILGPTSLAVWVVVIGYIGFGIKATPSQIVSALLILLGIALLLANAGVSNSIQVLTGDVLFVLAGALGALNSLILQRVQLPPVLTAAMTCWLSAVVVFPVWCVVGTSALTNLDWNVLAFHAAFQGIVYGGLVSLALNWSIKLIGSHRSSSLNALIPVFGILFAYVVPDERLRSLELLAAITIVGGVLLGVKRVVR